MRTRTARGRTSRRHGAWTFALALACHNNGAGDAKDAGGAVIGTSKTGTAQGDAWAHAGWTVEPSDAGTLRIRHQHGDVIRASYVFFGPNWTWADTRVVEGEPKDGTRNFDIAVTDLGIEGHGTVREVDPGVLELAWTLSVRKALRGIQGGGLEFKVDLDPANFGGRTPTTELLPDGKGFALVVGDERVELEVGGEIARVFFERGDPATVRVFLFGTDVAAGEHAASVRVRLPAGGRVLPAVADRYGGDDTSGWHAGALEWNDWPVDVSFLGHRPAGKHGRVRVRGDALVFEDGTPARFWGTNIVAYALFERDKQAIARQAERLAALGYNLVRLHHHDSAWVEPNVFDLSGGTTQALNDATLDSIDWWVKCLAEQGIYVWVDVHVGRKFLPGDGIDGYAETADQNGEGKGFNYVNPRIEALMQRFAEQYLGRANRYTKRTLANDPAVMGVLVTNENDITHHFGHSMLPDKGHPVHNRLFERKAKAFATKAKLPLDRALRTWEPGPAKIVLNELEHAFGRRAVAHLRKLGVQAPIATTSFWGDDGLYSLPALTAGDLVDVHSYGGPEALSTNPKGEANFIAWIGGAQVVGRPLTITEWNVPPPARDRFTSPLYVAAIGALQGWDAPMLYAYSQDPVHDPLEHPKNISMWSSWIDPQLQALMPAAAVMYRRGDVKPAAKTFVVDLGREGTYDTRRTPDDSPAIRTLVEQSRLLVDLADVPELDWDAGGKRPAGAKVVALDHDALPAEATRVQSDTGEIVRDWVAGVQTIDTARSQAAIGWIGGRRIELSSTRVEVDTPKAAVVFTALDDRPIATSQNILVTLVGRAEPGPGPALPYRSEPIGGRIAIASKAGALELVPLSGRSRGKPGERVGSKSTTDGDWQVFEIPKRVVTHWYLLRPHRPAAGR